MQPKPPPNNRDIVLVGGGHTHALVLRMWGQRPVPGARITLINPGPSAAYSGMLPGHIAGHYPRAALEIDLVKLAGRVGAEIILGAASDIDPVGKTVQIGARKIPYDFASIDVGVHGRMPALEGFMDHAVAVKPLNEFATAWSAQLARIKSGTAPATAAVIGGGVAGAEVALAMAFAMRALRQDAKVTVVDAGLGMAGLGEGARATLIRAMERLNVKMCQNQAVSRVLDGGLLLANQTKVDAGFILGAGGAKANEWLAQSEVPTTDDGFIVTGPTLQVGPYPDLFAVGDCAHLSHAPRPKAGVFAVRAAPILAQNLRAVATGQGALAQFNPQRDFLKLVSLGGKSAMAQKWGYSLSGPGAWRLKNWIDQRFMAQFRDPS